MGTSGTSCMGIGKLALLIANSLQIEAVRLLSRKVGLRVLLLRLSKRTDVLIDVD
jgi:hypothetical protein